MPWQIHNRPGSNPFSSNRYGETEWIDPTAALSQREAGNIMGNPQSWISGGLAGTGMRMGDTGRHRATLEEYLGPGMQLLYEMTRGGDDPTGVNSMQWMNQLANQWATPGGGNALMSNQGATDFIRDLFTNRGENTEFQSLLYDFDADPRNLIALIRSAGFQGMSQLRTDLMTRELQRKQDDWARFVDQTGEEIPFIDYLHRSGLLDAWGIL